eukprot:1146813-Pyramimonas_sp.AAC.1
MDGKWYWSALERDHLFGARHDAYSSTFSGASVYMNPEYEQADLLKAMKWAVWSTVTSPSPTSVIAVKPRWKKGAYMNLLRHRNVQVISGNIAPHFSFRTPHCFGKA